MISLDEALTIIADKIHPLKGTHTCNLKNALGKIVAEDIYAAKSLPPFTNTGVDGYAFYHDEGTKDFQIIGASYAGEPFQGVLEKGQAARIATGAVLPAGADSVAMQEICDVDGNHLHIRELPEQGANIRKAGHDIAKGDIVARKGKTLTIQDIAIFGALGITDVKVTRPVKIAVASSGMELANADTKAHDGMIIDTNTLMVSQMVSSPRTEVTSLPSIADNYDATVIALKNAAKAHDIIITTGGVSVGDRDFIRDVLHDHGDVLFWKIAIRPGKPVLVAKIGDCIVVGLPGNPVSAFVTCHVIVKKIIHALNGQNIHLPDGFPVTLANDITKPDHLRCFIRANYADGQAHTYKDQSSNLYSSLTQSTGLIDLEAGRSSFKKGDRVIYRPYCLFD